jgi:pyruvate ferredoxin oxidoreductase delta subunit
MSNQWREKRPLSAWLAAGSSADHKVGERSQRPVIDAEACTSCGICWMLCPEGIITRGKPYMIQMDYCHGCGLCAEECPKHAILMEDENSHER